MGVAPAGWYPDPSGGKRYWDGSAWRGAPSRPRVVKPRRPTWQRVLLVVAPVVVVGGCVGLLFLPGGRSWDDVSQQVDAEVACEGAVIARLKHPDVAEFDHRSYRAAASGSPAEVRGVVKTVNGFNAPVRVTYGCQMVNGRATVSELFEP